MLVAGYGCVGVLVYVRAGALVIGGWCVGMSMVGDLLFVVGVLECWWFGVGVWWFKIGCWWLVC